MAISGARPTSRSTGLGLPTTGALIGLLSLLVVVLAPLLSASAVTSAAEQSHVELGLPIAWVQQDRSVDDPPLPADLTLASPWEYPTDVSIGALVADVLIVAAVLGGLLALGGAVAAARRRRREISSAPGVAHAR